MYVNPEENSKKDRDEEIKDLNKELLSLKPLYPMVAKSLEKTIVFWESCKLLRIRYSRYWFQAKRMEQQKAGNR